MKLKLAFVALAVSAASATQPLIAQSLPAPDSQIVAEAEAKLTDAQRCDMWIRSAVGAIQKRAKANNVSPHEMKLGKLSLAEINVMKEEQGKCAAAAAITSEIQAIANQYKKPEPEKSVQSNDPGIQQAKIVKPVQSRDSQAVLKAAAKAMNKSMTDQSIKEASLRDSYKEAAKATGNKKAAGRSQISNSDLQALKGLGELDKPAGKGVERPATNSDEAPELSLSSPAKNSDDVVVITTNPKAYQEVSLTAIF